MRRVIHDFDDDQAVAILSNVRRHMPRDSTLLLLESVVPPGNTPHFAKSLDLDMLLFVGGRERTEQAVRHAARPGRVPHHPDSSHRLDPLAHRSRAREVVMNTVAQLSAGLSALILLAVFPRRPS